MFTHSLMEDMFVMDVLVLTTFVMTSNGGIHVVDLFGAFFDIMAKFPTVVACEMCSCFVEYFLPVLVWVNTKSVW